MPPNVSRVCISDAISTGRAGADVRDLCRQLCCTVALCLTSYVFLSSRAKCPLNISPGIRFTARTSLTYVLTFDPGLRDSQSDGDI